MIGSREPKCWSTSSSLVPGHDVLESDKHGMPHVEFARDIGRRHGDGVGLASGGGVWFEMTARFPPLVDGLFTGSGVEVFRELDASLFCCLGVCRSEGWGEGSGVGGDEIRGRGRSRCVAERGGKHTWNCSAGCLASNHRE